MNIISTNLMNDMHLESNSLFAQYNAAVKSNNISLAKSILDNNPNLLNQITIAENVNKVISNVNTIEQTQKDQIDNYLTNLYNDFQTDINNYTNKGTWNSTTKYLQNNFVFYNNLSYFALQDVPVGTLPTNATYWMSFNLKGVQGYPGLQVSFLGAWNSATNYVAKNAVTYQNKLWISKTSSTNKTPVEGTYWQLASSPEEATKTNISQTQPASQPIGDFWFKIN